jgi:hypothetical protein
MEDDEVELFSLNFHSVWKFNPDSEHKTVLVNNTGGTVTDLEGATIVPGLNGEFLVPLLGKPVSDEVGLALMMGLRAVDTRYICVLDPDFFVICPHWIEAMKAHMEAADVGIITAPPHPHHYNKRNTVTNNFIFIDTERFPKAFINFVPSKKDIRVLIRGAKIKKLVGYMLHHYFIRNTFLDCGDQIEARSETKIEYLTALYNHKESPYYTWLERIVPERFRLINKNVPYLVADDLTVAMETWMWNAIPFGVHCRKFFQRALMPDYEPPTEELHRLVYQFLHGYKMADG